MRKKSWVTIGFMVLSAACATSSRPTVDSNGNPTEPGGDTIPETPGAPAPPHALGTIILGESRASATGDSKPAISAAFFPDAKLAKSCTKAVASCEIAQIPKCTTGTTTGCATGELCTFNDSCVAKCVKACTKSCQASEECIFSGSSTDPEGGMSCRKKERFDAGAIAFSGTTQAITLFPPYAITPEGNGAPFMARTEIRVQATGGQKAGFEKFDEKFTSTTFLETSPPLTDIPRAEVFGSSDLTIGWVPGEDQVIVGVSGPSGAAKCTADDKTGTYSLEREVIREVMGTDSGTPSITISVTRERRETKKDKKAFGSLSGGQTVQPTGWLELVTTSSESHSYASCSTGTTMCGEQCVNTLSDPKNCGICGKVCPTSYYCSSGTCTF